MTTIIALVSQKGGVGKSTVSRALATEAAQNGLSVKIADLDTQQGTCVEWNRTRLEKAIKPIVAVEAFGTAAQALKIAPQYDLLIIDGPARASVGTLEIAKAANLVVQPTGPAKDDLIPAVKEFHALVKAGIPRERLVFALNGVGTEAEEREAREYITDAGYLILGCLYEQPAYRRAHNSGRSVTETSYKHLNKQADALIQSLIDKIGVDDDGELSEDKAQEQLGRTSVA